jgi:hypothetical protein
VPGPGDLFRGAQRTGARPAGGGAGRAQPRVLAVLSEGRLLGGLQNAHRHLSCQFTFACDGKPEKVNEHGAWARATRIATQTLNAKVWLPEVDKATHYHAAYVRPNWIRDMKVMVRYGLHTFYRPRNWGDGSNEAHWGHAGQYGEVRDGRGEAGGGSG